MRERDAALRNYRIVLSIFTASDPALVRRVRTGLARLEVVSHAPVRNYDGKARPSTDESQGGRRPPGSDAEYPGRDLGEWAAFQEAYVRRTPDYFRVEIAGCRTLAGLADIRREIDEVVEAWKRAPLPAGQEPEYGSPQWKRWVAESPEDAGRLATRFNLTRRRINQIRRDYRGAA